MENYGLAYLLTILTDTASHEDLTNYIINLDTKDEINRKIKYELFSKNETFFSKWSKKINGKEWVKILKSFNTLNEEEENIKTSLFYDDYVVDALIKDLKCNDWMELINSLDFTKSSDQEIIICLYDNQKIFDRLLNLLKGSDWMRIILRFDTKSELFSRLKNILINNEIIYGKLCMFLSECLKLKDAGSTPLALSKLGEDDELTAKIMKFLEEKDEKEKIINELKPETARALLYLLGYEIDMANEPNKWNIIDNDESGVKHIVGNITYDGNEYHLIIDSENVSYNSDSENNFAFFIKNSDYQRVLLKKDSLWVIPKDNTYINDQIYFSICGIGNSLALSYITRTDENMFEIVDFDYGISSEFFMKISQVMRDNNKKEEKEVSSKMYHLSKKHDLLVEHTMQEKNGTVVSDDRPNLDGTLVEVVASNKEVIGYVSDFFDLLREKVFPFFKGDIVSYLISNDTLNRFFPSEELASKLVRKRKISD